MSVFLTAQWQKVAQRLETQTSIFFFVLQSHCFFTKKLHVFNELIKLCYKLEFLRLNACIVQNYVSSIFKCAFLSLLIANAVKKSLIHCCMMLIFFREIKGGSFSIRPLHHESWLRQCSTPTERSRWPLCVMETRLKLLVLQTALYDLKKKYSQKIEAVNCDKGDALKLMIWFM